MEPQTAMETYVIRQRKEWTEILTGFETKNKYAIQNEQGQDLFFAAEVGGSLAGRFFLQAMRAWTIRILDPQGQTVLEVRRPFKFYFHRAEVRDASGNLLGAIQRRWSWMRRIYAVLDPSGQEVFKLFGPILHPWTFQVRQNDRQIGKITKKWSGLGKEMFTKADNFAAMFPAALDTPLKSLLLGAVFLIDFVHFETKN